MFKKLLLITLTSILSITLQGQVSLNNALDNLSYDKPIKYEIGGITVSGVKFLDYNVLKSLSGLKAGQTISVPGDEISSAIKNYWNQGLFSDVKISATKIVGNKIFLDIYLQERPRLSGFYFKGIRKSQASDIREKIQLVRGTQVTENKIQRSVSIIKNYFIDKGYIDTKVDVVQKNDTSLNNHVLLGFVIHKNKKIKIASINFFGNKYFPDKKLRRKFKDTKQKTWYNIFKRSKLVQSLYEDDKKKLITFYNEHGYRDAKIIKDSIYRDKDSLIVVDVYLEEGNKYYFRNINWIGNTQYTADVLSQVLGIKKGDIYDETVLDKRLRGAPDAVSTLYLDNGYLFFNVTPVEVAVDNDSIDLEMRMYEGKQARINKVTVVGNTKTHDHVILRELKSRPGELFSQTKIQRSIRELAQLGYFNPEKLNVNPMPNQLDGTVDLEYIVEEKPSDQIELSGGYGANMFIGSLGLKLTNLAVKDFFKKGSWTPIPTGDGQQLNIRAMTNGTYYKSANVSFIEPWLGGKKPNSLSVSVSRNEQSTTKELFGSDSFMKITGVSVGLGRRLEWPDSYFLLNHIFSFQNYHLKNFTRGFIIDNGNSNTFSITTILSRNSVDQLIFPRRGSMISLSVQLTPPYSLFKKRNFFKLSDADVDEITSEISSAHPDYTDEQIDDVVASEVNSRETSEKYKWIEYHKWKFKSANYINLIDKFVLKTNLEFGYLGHYSNDIGPSPFENFQLGGDGLGGNYYTGAENIGLRGYSNQGYPNVYGSLTPSKGGNLYQKFTLELRYPLSLNPNATFYMLGFFEAGNAWYDIKQYAPFNLKRSAGVGLRVYLAMFGMLGIDWGYGFDEIPNLPKANKGQVAFTIGQMF